jgi:hypothetical protein
LALLIAIAGTAHAQVGFTTGSVYHKWVGFEHFSLLAGVEVNTARFSSNFWWSSAAKSYVGNGWTAWEQAALYFNRGSFGAGPAALVRYTSNTQYTKTSLYPSIAMQCRTSKWRIEAFVHFRDQWTLNHGRGASLLLRRDLRDPSGRFGIAVRTGVTILKFSDRLADPYGSIMQVGISILPRRRAQ